MTGGRKAEALLQAEHVGSEDLLLEETRAAEVPVQAEAFELEVEPDESVEEAPPGGALKRVFATLAVLAVLGWFGAMLWLAAPALAGPMAPIELVTFIGALCVPPALIGIVWLITLRSSTAEARRWGATARAMRAEAASLERVVATLSRKIDENRHSLAEQTTLLMAMGDGAVERLQAIANGMGQEARAIDQSSRLLGDAALIAEKSVGVVMASLPRAHSEMTGMTASLDAAGLTASERVASLDAQLGALAARGREADEVANGAGARLAAHIARMEATSETAGARLESVTAEMSTAVDGVLERAAQAVDEARKGIAAQGDAMLAMLSANQAALDRAGNDSAEALRERIATIEEAVGRISASLGVETVRSSALLSTISGEVAKIDGEIASMHAGQAERTQELAGSISALTGSVGAMSEAMRTGESTARTLIGTAEELLVALDASAREIDETLPDALERLDSRIAASRQVVGQAKPELLALVTAAQSTHEAIEAIATVIAQQRDTLARTSEALVETLDTGTTKVTAMERVVDSMIDTTRRFVDDAAPQLIEALLRVRETASAAADQSRITLAGIVPEAERALEDAGGAAMRRAVDAGVRRQLTELAETTEAAVNAASRASERLTQQMLSLAETSAEMEDRIDAARADNGDQFSRRMSLLIESLNSASIDINKAFEGDVSDSAWAAYLKGDRGVFTRRAVRLLDSGDSREIARLYDNDDSFRDNVNRYIHDFEAMLRQILVLRDGSSMGVTLLSSDMGKLYVALAQAIERLRT